MGQSDYGISWQICKFIYVHKCKYACEFVYIHSTWCAPPNPTLSTGGGLSLLPIFQKGNA